MKSSNSSKALTILVFLLVAFGLIMLSSAGVVEGQKRFGSSSYFFQHQLIYGVIPGLLLFFLFSRIHYKIWKKTSLPLLIFVVGLMVLVFMPRFGLAVKGAQRWLDLGFVSFQPSEFLKLAMIIYLAAWFSQRGAYIQNWSYSIIPFLFILSFVGLLLILQPDIKTLAIVILISMVMYFFAGAKMTHILGFLLIFAILVGLLSYFEPYRLNRIKAYLNPSIDQQGVSYHINQALLSVGSGGMFGLGFGQSQQKINYLPEPVGDSIFAIIVEELGFIGGVTILGLFIFLILVLIFIAKNTHDQFGKLFVLGTAIWLTAQTFINVGAILNLIPLTGVPLPFFSYGSSSLVGLMAAMGIAGSVAKH